MKFKIFWILIICVSLFPQSLKSQSEVDSLKGLLHKAAHDTDKVNYAFRISRFYWHSNPDSVRFYAQKGLQIAKTIHYRKGEADCLNSFSAVYWIQRNYPLALDYTLKNLEIRQELGDKTGIFNASNNLGLIYQETQKYELALHYCKTAVAMANQLKDKKKIAKSSLNIGVVYLQLKDTSAALSSYYKALEYQTLLKDTIELSYIYYDIAEVLMKKDYLKAMSYFHKALFLAGKMDNKEIISASLQVLADEKRKSGKLEEAVEMSKRALSIASGIRNLKVIDLAAQSLYRTYLQKKDYRNSLNYYIIAENAQDSMLNESTIIAMSDLKYSFELNQKVKQIELLEKNKLIDQKNAQNQRLRFYLEIAAIVLFGLIAFLIYRHYRIQQQKKERDRYEKMLISAKEKAEESDRLKSAFLANMSHEIRTPMNAIIGFSECLANPGLPDKKRELYSKIIKDRSYDLLRIVEDVLDISRIESGQLKVVLEEFSLHKLMNDLYLEYNQKIGSLEAKKDILLKMSISPALKEQNVKGDRQHLKQVITNLLDNAIKFTHTGFIEFGVYSGDHSDLVYFVKDTGIGIAESKKEVIFERFRQADDVLTARKYGGSGLGLSIVKGIVSLMHGNIWLESKEGQGSAFYFSVPLNS